MLIQHKDARRLLPLIAKANFDQRVIRYSEAAEFLGRDPKSNSRAVAQVCDLIDAASAYAGIALLALTTVRSSDGGINRNAWSTPPWSKYRELIINNSKTYKFTKQDISKIEISLDDLSEHGNRASWEIVLSSAPFEKIVEQLTTGTHTLISDAINDIFPDINAIGSENVESIYRLGKLYKRDQKVRDFVLKRANNRCEYCGEYGFQKPDKSYYLETHHIIALANDGCDKVSNVIALCPNHHREAHFGVHGDELEQEMMEIVRKKF